LGSAHDDKNRCLSRYPPCPYTNIEIKFAIVIQIAHPDGVSYICATPGFKDLFAPTIF